MESTSQSQLWNYKKLFTTPENMMKVIDGNPWSESKMLKNTLIGSHSGIAIILLAH